MDISNAKCPECGKPMMPVVCLCGRCNVRLEGEFEVSPLARLSSEDQALAIAFIRSYGSIKSLQDSLGVSYPTARNRLEALVKKLDKAMAPPNSESESSEDSVTDGFRQGAEGLRHGLESLKDMGRQMHEGLAPLRDMGRRMREELRPLRHMKKDIRRHVRTHVRRHARRRVDVDLAEQEERARQANDILKKLEAGEIDVKQALEEL